MTPCHSVPAYDEKMYFDETNCAFGIYSRCSKCHRLQGEAKIQYTAPKGLRDSWTALSEVRVREFHARGEGRPLRFKMSKEGLVPLGYVPAPVEMEAEDAMIAEDSSGH